MKSRHRRLRVLALIDRAGNQGGAERFAVGLASHLPRDRFDAWICSSHAPDAATARAMDQRGIPVRTLGREAKWDVHRMLRLARLLRRERFDVLHAHKFGSNVWGTLIGRACRVPVIVAHEHTWSYEGDPVRAWLDGQVIGRLATRFVAVSRADAERMIRIEHVPSDKVTFIPSAYIPRPHGALGDLRAELGLAPNTPLVGAAVMMRPQKALHVLLDAHARMLAVLPAVHLVLAGDGECRIALERHAQQLPLGDRIHFLGRRRDVDSILQNLDVAAMSSDFEGTPLFVFECMANGTPLVATAVGGIPEVVDHDRTGLLVPPQDPTELANAITSLLLDPERRRRLAVGAAAQLDRYRIETVAAEFAALYEQLAARAHPVKHRRAHLVL